MNHDTDYMIIFAHPDDAEFGCAGSIANWTAQGKKVVYVACTSGDKGSNDPGTNIKQLCLLREKEQKEAAKKLGVKDIVFLRYPDQGIEDTSEFRKILVRQMRIFKPRIVITMDPYRKYIWHRDHRITGQVALDAVFPFVRDPLAFPDLMQEDILPHKVEEIWFFGSEDVNLKLGITGTFDTKLAALQCHKSQIDAMGWNKVEKWVKERGAKMARGTEFTYAEGFHQVKIPG
ncbi:MAG: PIG-L family deacetylase [Desulfobacteraceae bacterium]|nr:PIG-L family deacetylase [Desulfobacteraceae bacterium]